MKKLNITLDNAREFEIQNGFIRIITNDSAGLLNLGDFVQFFHENPVNNGRSDYSMACELQGTSTNDGAITASYNCYNELEVYAMKQAVDENNDGIRVCTTFHDNDNDNERICFHTIPTMHFDFL